MKGALAWVAFAGGLLFIVPHAAWAQFNNPIRVFGSVSYLRQDGAAFQVGPGHSAGWLGGVSVSLCSRLSVSAEFGSVYGEVKTQTPLVGRSELGSNVHSYLFGPEARLLRKGRLEAGGRALLGVARREYEEPFLTSDQPPQTYQFRLTQTRFGGVFGGVLDVYLSDSIAWRVAQPEVFVSTFSSPIQKDFRISTGVVIRFGGKR